MIEFIQQSYQVLGIEAAAGNYDLAGLASVLFILLAALGVFLAGRREPGELPQREELQSVEPPAPPARNWETRLRQGMSKSRGKFWHPIATLWGRGLSAETLDKVEEILYEADLGPNTTEAILQELKAQAGNENYALEDLKEFLKKILRSKMASVQERLQEREFLHFDSSSNETQVVMVVGVNGAGKTTTIGKLATQLRRQGATVVVGACDTFRAAAVDQLQVWCERAGCEMVRAKEGADPSGVAYEALQKARAQGAHYCLLDTAGRLHTKTHLMEELGKSKRVLGKLDTTAPHEVVLVVDAVTGQNAIQQAMEFNRALGLTGLILTKCDGSAKAGPAVAIVEKLQVPIAYIGVGEEVDDLDRFDMDQYLAAMLCE